MSDIDNLTDEELREKLHAIAVWKEQPQKERERKAKANGLRNSNDYIDNELDQALAKFQGVVLKTGYANLDKIQPLYTGTYVLGGPPSLGKTTFLSQMADSIARDGTNVLYFSLEQSTLELISKSLSRLSLENVLNGKSAGRTIDAIRSGDKLPTEPPNSSIQVRRDPTLDIAELRKQYKSTIGAHKFIISTDYSLTVDDIKAYLDMHLNANPGTTPVVIIDYLQAMASPDPHLGAREAVDANIEALKTYQKEHGLVLFLVSSYNRQSYNMEASYAAYKESGGIEYTADHVAGLQLQAHETADGDPQEIEKAKRQNPREISYVCLKNRHGVCGYKCKFLYFPEFEYFLPVESDEEKPQKLSRKGVNALRKVAGLGPRYKLGGIGSGAEDTDTEF